jgi:hypothetical protein
MKVSFMMIVWIGEGRVIWNGLTPGNGALWFVFLKVGTATEFQILTAHTLWPPLGWLIRDSIRHRKFGALGENSNRTVTQIEFCTLYDGTLRTFA